MHKPLTHLACIMDGNRRHARSQGKLAVLGHADGAKTVQMVVQFCLKEAIPYLSLYAFSLENFKRNATEITYLFDLLLMQIEAHAAQLHEQEVRVQFIGDRSRFPGQTIGAIERLEQLTAQHTRLHVFILFCYGGRQEIIDMVKNAVQKVQSGQIALDTIDDTFIKNNLWMGNVPDPDLIVRTGGVQRLSNFLLYQAAYSELYFTNTYWPALTEEELKNAVSSFYQTTRNFGS